MKLLLGCEQHATQPTRLLLSFLHLPYIEDTAKIEEFITSFVVSCLIIAVYTLYWIRQKD